MKEASILHPWLCCQIGARENYAIPRALNEQKLLAGLYTDLWFNHNTSISRFINYFVPRLSGRYAPIEKSKIISFNTSAFCFEFRESTSMHQGWRRIYNRNQWFQDKVIHCNEFEDACRKGNRKPIVFCYSYAAMKILKRAKEDGCNTVLGQIDGGLEEENIVANAVTKYMKLEPVFDRAPEQYWHDWKQECALADHIVVNSVWSRQLLVKAGIADSKIIVMPLMYDAINSIPSAKNYPDKFTSARPLQVLFLGSLIVRKGIGEMLETVKSLQGQPVEFWFVGQDGVMLTDVLKQNRQLHWVGPVPRSETARYYQMCDVFVFPTLSDGFGLTQLEAMGHGVPVIASNKCGEVVEHDQNGIVLPDVTSGHITDALLYCLEHPASLGGWSQQALYKVQDFSSFHIFPPFIKMVQAAL